MAKTMDLDKLTLDADVQPRVSLRQDVICEYAEAMAQGVKFPPLVAFSDNGTLWLADGFHRWYAAKQAKVKSVPVEVRKGAKREAVIFAVGCNSAHGLRRTNADKRLCVERLLADKECRRRSEKWIAEICGVSRPLVNECRRACAESAHRPMRETKDGRQYPAHPKPRIVSKEEYEGEEPEEDVEPMEAPSRVRAPTPQTTVVLPEEPQAAARALCVAFKKSFVLALAKAILVRYERKSR